MAKPCLIAGQLAKADPTKYSDESSALDDALRQLVRALFEGAVYSEGVPLKGDPGPDDPNEPPTPPEPDKWEQIDAGWWSHDRYEQYVYRHQQTELELLLLRPEKFSDKEKLQPELIEQVIAGAYRLDAIFVSWNTNSFDAEGFEGDCGYARIRVSRANIEAHFTIGVAELRPVELEAPMDAPVAAKREQPKRGSRPADVRKSVYEWLAGQPDGSRMCDRPHTELAHCYCTEVVKPRDELALRKCVDTIRKQVANWCRERSPRKR